MTNYSNWFIVVFLFYSVINTVVFLYYFTSLFGVSIILHAIVNTWRISLSSQAEKFPGQSASTQSCFNFLYSFAGNSFRLVVGGCHLSKICVNNSRVCMLNWCSFRNPSVYANRPIGLAKSTLLLILTKILLGRKRFISLLSDEYNLPFNSTS